MIDSLGNATALWLDLLDEGTVDLQVSTRPLGGSWQAKPVMISDVFNQTSFPGIAVDSEGNVAVVWDYFDGSIHTVQATTKLLDGDWGPVSTISSEMTTENAIAPKVAPYRSTSFTAIWPFFSPLGNTPQVSSAVENGPIVAFISPHRGPATGGTSVTITGSNFVNVTDVLFGGAKASFTPSLIDDTFCDLSSSFCRHFRCSSRVRGWNISGYSGRSVYLVHASCSGDPGKFTGIVATRAHAHSHKYRLTAQWNMSASSNLLFYRIYKRSQVVATIPVASQRKYKTYLRSRHSAKKFSIDVVNQDGIRSQKKGISIQK